MLSILPRLVLLVTLFLATLGAASASAAVRTVAPLGLPGADQTFDLRPTVGRSIVSTTLLHGGRSYRVDAARVRKSLRGGRVRVRLVRVRRGGRAVVVAVAAKPRRSSARRAVRRISRARYGVRAASLRGLRVVSAPSTTITSGPAGTVTSTSATFAFRSSQRPERFSCRLDAGEWQACKSPATFGGLTSADHVFEVRANDKAGTADPTPASRSWTIAASDPAPAPAPSPAPAPAPEPAPAPAPEPAPSPAPAPVPAPGPVLDAARLTWAPPALDQPVALYIDSSVIKARGSHKWTLDNSRDYLVTLGDVSSTLGGVVFSGGRNVVVMGGHITVPWAGPSASIESRRAVFFYRQVGTVHMEGTLIDNAGGDLSEGIQIDAPNAIVQIQNVRVTGIHARDQVNFSDNHPDLIQPFGGVRELRVDRFTGSTDSQGIFLRAAYAPIGKVDLRRVNMVGTHNNRTRILQHYAGETGTIPTSLSDVWITPQPGDNLYYSLLASTADGTTHTQTMSADGLTASWPNYKDAAGNPVISGAVRAGLPPGGEWVPASRVGLGYVSPGYL